MSYRVEVDNRAVKQLRFLPVEVRRRVLQAFERLQADPRPDGCVKLKGRTESAWRVRVGDYRALYRIDDAERLVRVYGVLRRDEAY